MKSLQHQFIEFALSHQVLRFGEFTLKSGRRSPYFFNLGQIYTGDGLQQLGFYYAGALQQANLAFDCLFGPAYKGIPLACATSIALAENFERNVEFAYNRKEAKDHGEGGTLVGAPLKGRVVIIDDVITAGTAFSHARSLIDDSDATLSGLIVALDRQERGQRELSAIQEIQQHHNIPVISIVKLEDIVQYLEAHAELKHYLDAIHQYTKQYGVSKV